MDPQIASRTLISTRYDKWPRSAALTVLVALLSALILSYVAVSQPIKTGPQSSTTKISDPALYQHIIDDVAHGANYYDAAAKWHREGHFPLKPFVTVRLPTLAIVSALIGATGRMIIIGVLAVAVIFAWRARLRAENLPKNIVLAATAIIAVSTASLIIPVATLFHESWAALLIALSLALRKPDKFGVSLAFGLAAALIRELALGYLILMLCAAAIDRRWSEALAWLAAIGVVAVALALHAQNVASVLRPDDLSSPGWNAMAGWPLFISTMVATPPLAHGPEWIARIIIPLSLFGWASLRSDIGLRAIGLLTGYGVMIMAFARPNTYYWGLLISPLLLGGIAFTPKALSVLLRRAIARD